jgi:hypothetical protein
MRRVRRDVVRSGRQDIELAIRFGDLTRSWHGEREEPARFGPPRTPSGGFWWLGHTTPHHTHASEATMTGATCSEHCVVRCIAAHASIAYFTRLKHTLQLQAGGGWFIIRKQIFARIDGAVRTPCTHRACLIQLRSTSVT